MFKTFFKKKNKAIDKDSIIIDEKIFPLACLLVEAALADEKFGEDEKTIIVNILTKQFESKDVKYIDEIVNKALIAFNESSDLISHTRIIKEKWPLKQRIEVIEMLWKVCLVDGILEPYEDMLIRRVSGLIYVDDKNRNIAKNNAISTLNDE